MKSTGEDQRAGGQGSRANAAALTLHVISRSCPSFPPVLLAHLLTLAPHFEASALYVPTVITMPWGWAVAGIQILGGALVGTSLLEFAARLPISHAVYRFAFGAGTTAVFATLFGMQAFYSRYGLYPGVRLLRDLWDSPAIVAVSVSTILSRTSLLSLLCLSAALCTLSWLAVSRARRTSRGLMQCAAMLLAGSLALWLPHEIWRAPQLGTTRLLIEHSLGVAVYASSALRAFTDDQFEPFRALRPAPAAGVSGVSQSPSHVVLIIAESLRADHLPQYGYVRDTTPYLSSHAGDWITFSHAWAHGSRTIDSLPVLFNSDYFAAIDRTNGGALSFWTALRKAGVRTHFYSSGAVRYGGLHFSIGLDAVAEHRSAEDYPNPARRRLSLEAYDYVVDDGLPLADFTRAVLRDRDRGSASFAVLHFQGSHYPFQYSDTTDRYLPTIRTGDGRPFDLKSDYVESRGKMTRLVNAYDNSIRHIDGLVEAVVDTLGSAGWLDDSVIILTSDHGEALGDRLNLFHGTTAYEEQVHVPLLVRVGRHLESLGPVVRERHDGITGLVDIAPSVLSMMAGMRRPVTLGFQGHSWLLGRTSKAYELVVFRGLAEKAAIITTRHKYIFDAVSRTAEAYDLEKDPRERSNLWNEPVAGSSVQFIEELKNRSVLR